LFRILFANEELGRVDPAKAGTAGRLSIGTRSRSGTNSEFVRLIRGADMRVIAMRIEYLGAIAIAVFIAGAGLAAVHSVGAPLEKQSTPTAAELATRIAASVDAFSPRSGG